MVGSAHYLCVPMEPSLLSLPHPLKYPKVEYVVAPQLNPITSLWIQTGSLCSTVTISLNSVQLLDKRTLYVFSKDIPKKYSQKVFPKSIPGVFIMMTCSCLCGSNIWQFANIPMAVTVGLKSSGLKVLQTFIYQLWQFFLL